MSRWTSGAIALMLFTACKGPPPPEPPKAEAPSAPIAAAPSPVSDSRQTELERIIAYTRANPWGENTGSANVRGQVLWSEGEQPPEPLARRSVRLKGVKGTTSEGVIYIVRTNERGEFEFDRIRAGDYKLGDDVVSGFHWRLRLRVEDGERVTVDLTPANSLAVVDDFPHEGK